MTIQITKPEVEALIKARLESGQFKDAEDVILQALQSSGAESPRPRAARRSDRVSQGVRKNTRPLARRDDDPRIAP